jgi:uncharacterized LabA/DUF88 family protein
MQRLGIVPDQRNMGKYQGDCVMNANVALDVDPRVAIFFDVQNLYFCTKAIKGEDSRINYAKLMEAAILGRNCIHASAYLMLQDEKTAGSFRSMLHHCGIDVKYKLMEIREKGERKFNISRWDIGLAIQLIKWAPKVETLILVSGDGVFVDVVQYIRAAFPVRVEVCGFMESTSFQLKNECDDFINLSSSKVPADVFMAKAEAEKTEAESEK